MKYSEVIKQLMVDNNLSQQRLADELNVNQTTISQWLREKKKPNYDNIFMICKKFNIEPNQFFDLD